MYSRTLHFTGTEGRARTGTGETTHRILSPVRLPIPPPRHKFQDYKYMRISKFTQEKIFFINKRCSSYSVNITTLKSVG